MSIFDIKLLFSAMGINSFGPAFISLRAGQRIRHSVPSISSVLALKIGIKYNSKLSLSQHSKSLFSIISCLFRVSSSPSPYMIRLAPSLCAFTFINISFTQRFQVSSNSGVSTGSMHVAMLKRKP